MMDKKAVSNKYGTILREFFSRKEEAAYYAVSELGKELVLSGAGPDMLIDIHGAALKELIQGADPMTVGRMVVNANDLLLNGIMAYAMTYYSFMDQLHEERQKIEQARIEADLERDKLDNIVSAIDADLLLLDRDLKILWVNRRLKERTQHGAGGIIGKQCNLTYCNIDKAPNDCPALIAFRSGKPVRQEHPITHPDGATRHYYFTCSPIKNSNGAVDRVLELVQDVTDRHEMEESLRKKNEELERFNKLFVDREFRIKELKDKVAEWEMRGRK